MKIATLIKTTFVVIGREGSTENGAGFVQRLWADANGHFDEVADLAKKDESGNLVGIWGAMTDLSRSSVDGSPVSAKGCIWPEWNVRTRHRLPMVGQSG